MPSQAEQRVAVARALLLKPNRVTGPQEPTHPLPLSSLLAGGEWRGWDVRVDVPLRARVFLEGSIVSKRSRQRVEALIKNVDIKTLKAAESALMADHAHSDRIPTWHALECRDLARVLVLARAELGDPQACAEAAGLALNYARDKIVMRDLGAWFFIRAALWWAYGSRSDAADIEYVPAPRYADLSADDELLEPLAQLLGDMRAAQVQVQTEEDLLRGGAGAQGGSDLPPVLPGDPFDPLDLGDGVPVPSPAPGPTLTVFPRLDHLPKPSSGARDRGDSPRALVEDLAGRPLPLVPAPDPAEFRRVFLAAVPWAEEVADIYANDLVGAKFAAFRPRILLGPPGQGKTAGAKLLVRLAGLEATVFSGAGVTDGGAFAGTSRQWGTWRLSTPAQAILRARKANAGIIVDEIEKSTDVRRWGRLDETLLPFLEHHTAKEMHDPALESPVDCSAVSDILTANGLDGVSPALVDRCQIVRWQGPRRDDLPFLARAFIREIRAERGLDESWIPYLDGDELDALDWWRGGSMRPLRRAVEAVLASRDAYTPRH